ncbi:MAG: DUF4394 domain-containing protein [Alphaproteobacteria bacterium]|nr:DUF4394 domain-containing protein [Alphaproteobacteria bacterium]
MGISRRLRDLAFAAAVALPVADAAAADIAAVTDRGELLLLSDTKPGNAIRRGLHGQGFPLIGIDVRAADGVLYGVTPEGAILAIDPVKGQAFFKAMMSVAIEPAAGYVVDFNPVADRLRIVGAGGQNLRVDVGTGATIVDGRISGSVPGGPTAGAYTNAVAGAPATQLFVIAGGAYALQDPPNEGVLRPVGTAGIAADGMDFLFDGARNHGWAVAGNVLYTLDPATGATAPIGPIGAAAVGRIVDIAVLPPRR